MNSFYAPTDDGQTKSVSPNLIRLAPPLVIEASQIAEAVQIITSALSELAE